MITLPVFAPALLLAQAAGAGGASAFMPIIIQFALIIAIIYFIMIRPQQAQRRKHEEVLKGLKRGDEVVTAGGIIGEVIHIKEGAVDGTSRSEDRVTIKSGESRLVVERSRIARVNGAASGSPSSSKLATPAE